jgi:hypothetical protein
MTEVYWVKSPDLPENTIRSYTADDIEHLEDKLRDDGLDCYDLVHQ